MATWITKPWIEQALKCENVNKLPKLAKAQVLKFQEPSDKNNKNEVIGYISDKKLFVKAIFSETAVGKFKRDNPSIAILEIRGGLIFIKKYSVEVSVDSDLGSVEFVIKVNEFKFAGGEGNTQFGSDIIDSCTYPPLHARLRKLWRLSQVKTLLRDTCCHGSAGLDESLTCVTDVGQIESSLLKNHEGAFIPEDMEKKLAEIPEWKASYCPHQSLNTGSNTASFQSGLQSHPAGTADQGSPGTTSVSLDCVGGGLHDAQSCSKNERHIPISGVSNHCDEASSLLPPKPMEKPLSGESKSFVSVGKSKGFRENEGGICSDESSGQSRLAGVHTPVPAFSSERLPGNTHSNGKQLNLNIPDKQVLLNAQAGSKYCHSSRPGGRPTVDCDWSADTSSTLGCGKQVTRHDVREEEADTLMEESVICDSQVAVIIPQPLKGLVTDTCSSSSEPIQQKEIGEESYSRLQRKSWIGEANSCVDMVPCSSSSEESDCSQQLQNIPSFNADKSSHFSLSDSQLNILLEGEDNVSINGGYFPPCSKSAAAPPQEGAFTQVKPKSSTAHQTMPSCDTKTVNNVDPSNHLSKWWINVANEIRSASNYAGIKAAPSLAQKVGNYKEPLSNQRPCKSPTVVNNGPASKTGEERVQTQNRRPCYNPGIVSNVDDANTKKELLQTKHDRHCSNPRIVNDVVGSNMNEELVQARPKKTTSHHALGDFDELLSRNTWSVSQTKERETAKPSDREKRLSGKRKRSQGEAALQTHPCSPPKQTRHEPAVTNRRSSPDSTSGSRLSQRHLNNLPDVSLTQAVEFYSQQDSLILDNSDSAGRESNGETTDSEGDLVTPAMCDSHENLDASVQRDSSPSPSILRRSRDEPCTLETPPFDSLPSFQPLASTPQHHKIEACDASDNLWSFVPEYWREKKLKRRRKRFDWFSDDY